MMKLTCAALGMMDDPFEATGETEEEVMMKMKEHVMASHPEVVEKMKGMSEQESMDMMKAKIEQM